MRSLVLQHPPSREHSVAAYRIVALVALFSFPVARTHADEAAKLPLSRVVAFNTGVAFFEYAGTVDGDQSVTLKFEARDINDVLKSLVLLDLDGGEASSITYDNREPLARTLTALSVDLTGDTSLAGLLRQLRGQEIEVEASGAKRGRIVGVEQRDFPLRDTAIQRDFLLLSTAEGLRSVALDEVELLRLINSEIDKDFQRALKLMAGAQSSQQKEVSLRFRGEGKRRVQVGFIQELPVWKTTYRLVLDDDRKPFLQGWAIVENTTNKDWEDVELSLVSGRPISFLMDLYEPLYVRRPSVALDLSSGLTPRIHGQGIAGDPFGGEQRRRMEETSRRRGSFGSRSGGGGFGGGGFGGEFGGASPESARQESERSLSDSVSQTSQAMGVGGDVGELFRYLIDAPVSLASEHSAMLPIVTTEVEGEKLGIYNPATHAEHPLSGFRLKNSTNLHLMQGPIAVFDGDEFAGDARIADIPPGGERLISYALDLKTEVFRSVAASKTKQVNVQLNGLALVFEHLMTRSDDYAIKNSDNKPKTLLIERAVAPGWRLVAPRKAEETTRDLRRFKVLATAGETTLLRVTEQQPRKRVQPLVAMDDEALAKMIEARGLDDASRQVLKRYAERRKTLSKAQDKLATLVKRASAISFEQERIRQNMETLDRTSSLYARYEKKLDAQETEIEQLRKQTPVLSAEVKKLQASLLERPKENKIEPPKR